LAKNVLPMPRKLRMGSTGLAFRWKEAAAPGAAAGRSVYAFFFSPELIRRYFSGTTTSAEWM
jgi:hypothetical protein